MLYLFQHLQKELEDVGDKRKAAEAMVKEAKAMKIQVEADSNKIVRAERAVTSERISSMKHKHESELRITNRDFNTLMDQKDEQLRAMQVQLDAETLKVIDMKTKHDALQTEMKSIQIENRRNVASIQENFNEEIEGMHRTIGGLMDEFYDGGRAERIQRERLRKKI